MAVKFEPRLLIRCDLESERDLLWPIDALVYTADTDKYYKQEFGSWTEVPVDEIFLTSLIPIEKLAFSGIPSEEKYLRSDGSWAEPGISGGTRVLYDSWNYDDDNTASDPGANNIRLDDATFAGTTNLYVSDLSINNNDFSAVISNLDTGDTVYMQEKDNPANAIRFQISATPTDNTDWWTIPVTVTASVGTIWVNGQDITVLFSFGGSGGGGGGHTIQEEGTPLTQRANLNFVGATVTATDDAGNDATVITITDPSQVDNTAYDATSWDGATTIAPSKNAVRDILEKMRPFQTNVWFNQVVTIDQDKFLFASTITKISKTAGVATASYQINAGSIVSITFTGDDWTGSIAVAANDRITWRITYTGGYTSANLSYLSNRT